MITGDVIVVQTLLLAFAVPLNLGHNAGLINKARILQLPSPHCAANHKGSRVVTVAFARAIAYRALSVAVILLTSCT